MNIYHFYFFLILLNEIFSSKNKIYRIPFGLFRQQNSEKDSNIINNIVTNGKYLNLSIGTPPQITPFELDTNSQTFSASNKTFNRNDSLTYEQISRDVAYFDYEVAEYGYTSKDILNIDNVVNTKINFILGTKFENTKLNNLGIIGLLIPKRVQYGVYPFFTSLKNSKLLNSSIWTLKFFDNISLIDQITYNEGKDNLIGEFIFGDEPSKYEKDRKKYNSSEYYKINPLSNNDIIYWEFEFTNIYLTFKERKTDSKIYFLGRKAADIIINFSFIIGPTYFFDFIKEKYFSTYLKNFTCLEKKVDFYFTYIECDSSLKIESFPDLCFEQAGFDYIFNFSYKDLFIEDKENNKYIFLILKREYFLDWVLGTVFLRKFQLVFDEDSRKIGFYRQFHENNNNENINESITKIVVIIFLIIIFSVLLIIFGMVIQKICFKERKKRANELKDNFEYISENNDENGLVINDEDKKIIKDDEEISSI